MGCKCNLFRVITDNLFRVIFLDIRLKSVTFAAELIHQTMATSKNINEVYAKWQALQPLGSQDTERLSRRFTLDFNYNSNHIEGNTLTYGQTELLLLFGHVVGGGIFKDFEEMWASVKSLQLIIDNARINRSLSVNFIVEILRTLYWPFMTPYGDFEMPSVIPEQLHDLVRWYNEEEQRGEMHPVDLAILFHYRYIRIHPFEDGNGRIARLLVNYILTRHDYPMVVVRSRKKKDYLEALHQADLRVGSAPSVGSHASLESIKPFQDYFTKLVIDEIQGNIDFLQDDGLDSWWFDGEKITFQSPTVGLILKEMHSNPDIQVTQLAQKANISRISVQKTIKTLESKGYIMRDVGSIARWHVCITCACW